MTQPLPPPYGPIYEIAADNPWPERAGLWCEIVEPNESEKNWYPWSDHGPNEVVIHIPGDPFNTQWTCVIDRRHLTPVDVPLPAHLLYLDSVDDWGAGWKLTCEHDTSPQWHQTTSEGVTRVSEQCWLQSWWSEVGPELLKLDFAKDAQPEFPLAVKPSDDWDADGGTIVVDA
jgi:hypothetical protein